MYCDNVKNKMASKPGGQLTLEDAWGDLARVGQPSPTEPGGLIGELLEFIKSYGPKGGSSILREDIAPVRHNVNYWPRNYYATSISSVHILSVFCLTHRFSDKQVNTITAECVDSPGLLGFWSSGELMETSMAVHFLRRDCGSLNPTLPISGLFTFKFEAKPIGRTERNG